MNLTKKVVCAISGGVDSCIAAHMLKKQGFNLHGVFMRNWDIAEERTDCSVDEDAADAAYVCNKLNIPFHEVNFVREYWNEVFCELIEGYTQGITPNPDVLCNKRIKFGHFFKYATETLGADYLATGHYARSSWGQFLHNKNLLEGVNLLRPKDQSKDQTLFLSQISQQALSCTMFPIGGYLKSEVKKIAKEIGMDHFANKKESAGICFIGRRNFRDFMSDYVKPNPGNFIDFDTGKIVGKHNGVHLWTVGQRVLIGGLNIAYFVLRKIVDTSDIYVVSGSDHPALYNVELILSRPHWINRNPFLKLNKDGKVSDNRRRRIRIDDDIVDAINSSPDSDGTFKLGEGNYSSTPDSSTPDSSTPDSSTPDSYADNRRPHHISAAVGGFSPNDTKKNFVRYVEDPLSADRRIAETPNKIASLKRDPPHSLQLTDEDGGISYFRNKAASNFGKDGYINNFDVVEKIGVQFRFQHPHAPVECVASQLADGCLRVELSRPMRAIAPGQYGVLYDGPVCLGSAAILKAVPDKLVEERINEILCGS